jgi:enoyl-CoA hydratase
MTGESTSLELEEDAGVATVVLNRPDRLNALDLEQLRRLGDLVAGLEARPVETRPRALIVHGAGDKAFVAGADIRQLSSFGPEAARELAETGHRLGRALEEASFPSIAAVNGFALGGGLELALACDLILCSDRARFGQPEVNLGLIPGFGGTFRLAARTGVGWARRLTYTGEIIDAARAETIGLVEGVYPASELLARARELAREIAKKGPLAVRAAKRSILRGLGRDSSLLADHEALRFSQLFATQDAKEGLSAFLAKRTPNFSGR